MLRELLVEALKAIERGDFGERTQGFHRGYSRCHEASEDDAEACDACLPDQRLNAGDPQEDPLCNNLQLGEFGEDPNECHTADEGRDEDSAVLGEEIRDRNDSERRCGELHVQREEHTYELREDEPRETDRNDE